MAATRNPFERRGRLFEGRRVIVTGASSGIGRDTATMFAQEGASVALFARREQMLTRLAREIESRGGRALPIACDVSDEGQVRKAIDQVDKQFGGIDVLINNAGVLIPSPFRTARLEDLRRMMDINFFGAVHTTQAVLPIMERHGHGNIVNISSIAGRRGGITLAGYSASKSALIGFTEALRAELFASGITASLVIPASVDTQMLDNPEWESRRWAVANFKMPPRLVTLGVIAAVTLGMAEVEVPLGIVTAQKIANLFPDLTAAWIGLGSRAIEAINEWMGSRIR